MITMKKLYIILAAAALIAAAASCNKTVVTENEPAPQVKVDITVGNLEPGTKAIKTGWANGDVINVYLEDAAGFNPDFTLTFDGTKWNASAISSAVAARLSTSGGAIRGFWEATNSCMSSSDWVKSAYYIDFPNYSNKLTTGLAGHLVADFCVVYSFDGSTLTATIDSWRFRTNLQIVVTGISLGSYTLYSDDIENMNSIALQAGDSPYTIEAGYYGTGETNGRIFGIPNADGVAFVGAMAGSKYSGSSMTLYLIDNTTSKTYSFTKVLDSDLYNPDNRVNAIKIPFSKFSEVTP